MVPDRPSGILISPESLTVRLRLLHSVESYRNGMVSLYAAPVGTIHVIGTSGVTELKAPLGLTRNPSPLIQTLLDDI